MDLFGRAELGVVRKGIRVPDLTSLFPSGEPRADARRRLRAGLGGEGQCSNPCRLRRFIRFAVSKQPSLLQESPQPRKQTSPFPLCASARVLPIRSRSAFSYAPIGFWDGLQLEVVRKGGEASSGLGAVSFSVSNGIRT
jgi:hypothetical protein